MSEKPSLTRLRDSQTLQSPAPSQSGFPRTVAQEGRVLSHRFFPKRLQRGPVGTCLPLCGSRAEERGTWWVPPPGACTGVKPWGCLFASQQRCSHKTPSTRNAVCRASDQGTPCLSFLRFSSKAKHTSLHLETLLISAREETLNLRECISPKVLGLYFL